MKLITQRAFLILVALLSLFNFLNECDGDELGAGSLSIVSSKIGWQDRQEKWWTDEFLIKKTIVSSLLLLESKPDLLHDEDYARMQEDAVFMLLIYDRTSSPSKLSMIASLTSYHLGEANAETLDCLILRNGTRFKPILKRLEKRGVNECRALYEPDDKRSMADRKICLSAEEYRTHISTLIDQIDNDASCNIEK